MKNLANRQLRNGVNGLGNEIRRVKTRGPVRGILSDDGERAEDLGAALDAVAAALAG